MNISTNHRAASSETVNKDFFHELDDSTRVWIHPLFREVNRNNPKEISWIESQLKKMTENWTYHSKPVPGEYIIHRDRFVVLANSHKVGGCGIDYSCRTIDGINRYLGGDPANLTYYTNNLYDQKIVIHTIERHQLKSAIDFQKITPKTTIINLQLTTLKELREGKLELPAAETFLSRYFNN